MAEAATRKISRSDYLALEAKSRIRHQFFDGEALKTELPLQAIYLEIEFDPVQTSPVA